MLPAVVGLLLLGPLVYLIAVALGGADELVSFVSRAAGVEVVKGRHQALFPWLLLSLVAGAVAVAGWWRARSASGAVAKLEEDAARLREERERDRRAAREQLERQERETARARAEAAGRQRAVERLEAMRRTEQTWNRELRSKILELHHERGVLGDLSDIRTLVLRLALTLLEADKGLLLSRANGETDMHAAEHALEVVAGHGFDSDPKESALARRFAAEVIDHDQTVREDQPEERAESDRSSADEEIRNLVAIPIYIRDEFSGVVVCANREGGFEELDDEVLISLGDHAGAVLDNHRLHGELRSSYVGTVRVLAEAIEAKDAALRGHSEEVVGYVSAVADHLGLERRRREELMFASLLHDVGKIGISERILLKPGALSAEEMGIVRLHPRIGYRLIEQVPALRAVGLGILHHHERYDGQGYPSGLGGEEIPLEARIIAVADSFSAMITDRPYREPLSLDGACTELERCAGTQFDPGIVKMFVQEVRCRPVQPEREGTMELVFADPELAVRRIQDGTVLGTNAYSLTDSVTLLYGHRHFHEMVEAEASRTAVQDEPYAIVLLELGGLRSINRRRGYAAGDSALKQAAKVVSRAASGAAGTAFRHSGSRLALVVPYADETVARALSGEVSAELWELDPDLAPRVGCAVWSPGDDGAAVVGRALLELADLSRGLA